MLTTVSNSRQIDLVDHALAVVRREGPAALTMRNVAAEAGITATALYRHFADKDALLAAVVKEAFDIFQRSLIVEMPVADPAVLLRLAFDRFLHFGLEHPNYYRLLFVEIHEKRDLYPTDFVEGKSRAFRQLRDIVADCMRARFLKGQGPKEAADVALTLYAHMHGLIVLFLGGRFPDVRGFQRFYFESLERVLAGLAA